MHSVWWITSIDILVFLLLLRIGYDMPIAFCNSAIFAQNGSN